ncbi:MAG: hypothetical protein LBU34_16330 [Planctomycetaceae bacterium]|jgi:hypothetical protein|nr:hypothetical protein [Planctomycetaceae bacterium]
MIRDFIPQQDGAFLEWSKTLVAYATSYYTTWNIPSGAFNSIQMLLNDFETAYNQAELPNHGKVDVLRKDEARDAFKKELRAFIKSYLTYNPLVSDPDRESMGLPIHKTKHTPIPPPTTYPEAEIDTSIIRQVAIHFRDYRSENKAKPFGVHGAEIRWDTPDNPPTNVEDLRHSSFDTKTPFILTFEESDRGKRVYFCLRWENTKGEKGPWGEIESAIIP